MLLINLRHLKPIVLLAFDIPFAQLTPDTDVMSDGDFFGRGYFANVVASVLGFSQRNHQPISSLAFLFGMHKLEPVDTGKKTELELGKVHH